MLGIFYPFLLEDRTFDDGVVHHFLFPCAVAYEFGISPRFLFRPLFAPCRVAFTVDGLHLRHMYTFSLADVSQYRGL